MPENATAVGNPTIASLMDRTICAIVSFGGFGLTRKASMAAVSVNSEKSMLTLSKRLLRSKEYDAIRSQEREIKGYLQKTALPSIMKSGSYLIPIPLVEEVEQYLLGAKTARLGLIDAFLRSYPAQVEAVRADLRDLYDPRNYPSCEDLQARFSFEWQYIDFGVPGRLKAISARLFESERDKAAEKLREATDDIRQVLRAGFAELIANLTRALAPAEEGKRKVLRSATLKNLQDFMQLFEMRNVTDDAELTALVSKARELMTGIDRETLKNDDLIQQKIRDGFSVISGSLETMVVERGARQISFEDDDEAAAV